MPYLRYVFVFLKSNIEAVGVDVVLLGAFRSIYRIHILILIAGLIFETSIFVVHIFVTLKSVYSTPALGW